MRDDSARGPTASSGLTTLRRVVASCEEFEAAWREGRRPRIEDLLADVAEAERTSLLRAMMAVELELRIADGDRPEPSEYRARFPEESELVDTVFAELSRPTTARPETAVDEPRPGDEAPLPSRSGVPAQRFRVLHEHARGGIGVVYLAHDAELDRRVALKELRSERAGDPLSREYFVREALITGGLEHPGIVSVHGFGRYRDGRPFYAMRFIRGDSLKEAIAAFHAEPTRPVDPSERSLRLRGLITQLVGACNAIAYAHDRGVLNRDIKPANIMVGKYGETLVVDWGLAKLIGRSGEPATAADEPPLSPSGGGSGQETQPGSTLGTPQYMAPEQADGRLEELGPPSDVYSLGATLYTILAGHSPFPRKTTAETLAAARRGDFAPPRALNPSIPRPLEAVCLKAMSLQPEDRYPTAKDLAADLEKWLADEPVSALREPLLDRARRWSRKHRTLVTTTAALFLAGVAGAVGFAWVVGEKNRDLTESNAQLAIQRGRAEEREELAIDAVKRFRDAVADNPQLKNSPELEDLRKTLLAEPLAFFRSLRDRLQADGDTRPEALARLGHAAFDLGLLADEIGDKQDALRALEEALRVRERLARENPTVADYAADLAASHHNIGGLQQQTGQLDAARESLDRAVEIWERLARERPTVTEFARGLAASLHNTGKFQHEASQVDAARESYGRAVEIEKRLARENPSDADLAGGLAMSLHNIGMLQHETGQVDAALDSFGQALEIRERLASENPTLTRFAADLASSHHSIGILQDDTGQVDAALESFDRALEIRERLARENPTVTDLAADVARTHQSMGLRHSKTGQLDAALAAQGRAVEIWGRLAREHPSVTEFQRGLAACLHNLGAIQHQTGQVDMARGSFAQVVEIWERLTREQPGVPEIAASLARIHHDIGIFQDQTGQPDEAEISLRRALEIRERLARENPTVTDFAALLAFIHLDMGSHNNLKGRLEEADEWYGRSREIYERLASENPTVTNFAYGLAKAHINLGVVRQKTGRTDAALESMERANEILQRLARENPTVNDFAARLAESRLNMGVLQQSAGRADAARESFERALEIQERLARENPTVIAFANRVGVALHNLGDLDRLAGRFAEARDRLRGAVAWQRKALDSRPRDPFYRQDLTDHLTNLILVHRKLGDDAGEAEAQRQLAEHLAADPQFEELDARLRRFALGEAAADNPERLALAQRAYDTRNFSLAARLWSEALDADSALADDRRAQHRYNAACAAALAAAVPPPHDLDVQTELRAQALAWLQAELDIWSGLLDSASDQQRQVVAQILDHWRRDQDLASLRGDAIDKLPEAERGSWKALWTKVGALYEQAEHQAADADPTDDAGAASQPSS